MAYREEFVCSTQEEAEEKAKACMAGLDVMRQPHISGRRVIHHPDGRVEYAVAVSYWGLD